MHLPVHAMQPIISIGGPLKGHTIGQIIPAHSNFSTTTPIPQPNSCRMVARFFPHSKQTVAAGFLAVNEEQPPNNDLRLGVCYNR